MASKSPRPERHPNVVGNRKVRSPTNKSTTDAEPIAAGEGTNGESEMSTRGRSSDHSKVGHQHEEKAGGENGSSVSRVSPEPVPTEHEHEDKTKKKSEEEENEPPWVKLARVHVHPEDNDTEDEDAFDEYDEKKYYFLFQYLMCMVVITTLVLAGAAPGWVRRPDHFETVYNTTLKSWTTFGTVVRTIHGNISARAEYNLWAHCRCYPTSEELCPTVVEVFLGGKVVSLLGLGGTGVCIFVFLAVYTGFCRRYHRKLTILAAVSTYSVAVAQAISFSAFSAAYARTLCDERIRERGFASWIFGLRVTEFVVMVITGIGVTIQLKKRSKRFGKTFLFLYSGLWCSGIVSTVSRAWIQTFDKTVEIGLWQACGCYFIDCNAETGYFQSMEAFTILSVTAMFFWMVLYFLRLSKWTQFPCLIASVVFSVLAWILFWVWRSKSFCRQPSSIARGYEVQWAPWVYFVAPIVTLAMIANMTYRWWNDVY